MAFCRHCGTELANDSAFCGQCGKPVNESSGGMSKEEKKRVRVLVYLGAIVLLVLLFILGILIGKELGNDKKSTKEETISTEKSDEEAVDEVVENNSGDAFVVDLLESHLTSSSLVTDSFEPMVQYRDVNDDGIKELLLFYEEKDENGEVWGKIDYWIVREDNAEFLEDVDLYCASNGDTGYVYFCEESATGITFVNFAKIAFSDGKLASTDLFIPLTDDSMLDTENARSCEWDDYTDGESIFIINGEYVSEDEYWDYFGNYSFEKEYMGMDVEADRTIIMTFEQMIEKLK